MFRKDILEGKAGIITGGTSGIGFEIAKYLLNYGAKVTVIGRNEEKLKAAVATLGEKAFGTTGDVRDNKAVEECLGRHLEQYNKVDFLLNNAAGNFLCPLENMSENAFKSVNDIITLGTFLWSKAVFPHMKEQKSGRIINTGTTYAFGPGTLVGHSGAAKAAVLSLTKTMAVEWGPYGISCNMIAPGPVENTEGVRRLMGSPEIKKNMYKYIPLSRMAHGWEIGALATFLLSPMAEYINGAAIPIDGGLHLTTPGLLPAGIPMETLSTIMQKQENKG